MSGGWGGWWMGWNKKSPNRNMTEVRGGSTSAQGMGFLLTDAWYGRGSERDFGHGVFAYGMWAYSPFFTGVS